MDERLKETGDSNPAAPELDEDERARLIGSIVAEWISSLGGDQAFTSGGVVIVGGGRENGALPLSALDICRSARGLSRPSEIGVTDDHAGAPLNSASVQPQMARPHFAQRGIRSK